MDKWINVKYNVILLYYVNFVETSASVILVILSEHYCVSDDWCDVMFSRYIGETPCCPGAGRRDGVDCPVQALEL